MVSPFKVQSCLNITFIQIIFQTNAENAIEKSAVVFGSIVYNGSRVYKRQNFLKVVVHVIIIYNVIKPLIRRNPGNGYL